MRLATCSAENESANTPTIRPLLLCLGAGGSVTKPLIGAFGERAVECELLRRGWVTANVHASIRNVPDFDLFAVKQNRFLQIRVKTCSPGEDMQFSTPKNQAIITNGIPDTDFFVIVRMGEIREGDQFYVVPTRVVFQAIEAWRIEALNTQRDNGDRGGTRCRPCHLRSKRQSPAFADLLDDLPDAVDVVLLAHIKLTGQRQRGSAAYAIWRSIRSPRRRGRAR
jgi:hypothetical protein